MHVTDITGIKSRDPCLWKIESFCLEIGSHANGKIRLSAAMLLKLWIDLNQSDWSHAAREMLEANAWHIIIE